MSYVPFKLDDTYNVVIFNYKKEVLPIKDMVEQFSVYFDVFQQTAKIELIIQDSVGMLEKLPILGDEQVLISFKTNTMEQGGNSFYEDEVNMLFQVYKITDRKQTANRSSVYTLHGIAQEGVNNMRYAVYRSYADMKAEEIASAIYEEYLLPSDEEYDVYGKSYEIDSDEAEGEYTFIFSGERPLEAINVIGREAKRFSGDSKSSNYVFFQRPEGWVFKTLDSLISENRELRDAGGEGTVQDFYFVDPRTEAVDEKTIFDKPIRPDQKILSLHIVRQLDNSDNLEKGLFNHTTQVIDTITKRYVNDPFLYETDKEDIAHLENIRSPSRPHVHAPESIFSSERAGTKFEEFQVKNFFISHIGDEYYQDDIFTPEMKAEDAQLRNPRKLHEFYKYDYASRVKLNNVVLAVSIPGNTDLKVGEVVNLNMLSNNLQAVDPQERNALNRLFGNEKYGGYFFVTNVRHTYARNGEQFVTHFNCVKDVYTTTKSGYSNDPAEVPFT